MDRRETLLVLGTLQAAYPAFNKGLTREQLETTVRLWMDQFADKEYALVSRAVSALIATRVESYPPTIGAVNEMIQKLTNPQMLPMEAWNHVRKAISNGTYHSKEEWEKLPKEVQMSISPEQIRSWAMEENFNEGVAQSNFIRSFTSRQKTSRETDMLPEHIRSLIGQASGRLQLNG